MIKFKELRDGNYIRADNAKKWHSGYNGSIVPVDLDIRHDKEEDYSPIELSPEILEKAGFDFLGSCQVLNLDKYFSLRTYDSTGSDIYLDFDGDSEWRSYHNNRCKHLHILQNLYYSLTGIELEIKF